MNYGISVLFRAIPLLMALFCFGYGFFVFNYGVDSSRFVAGPVVFSLGFICIALFATAATIIRQIIHTYNNVARFALPILGYLSATITFSGGLYLTHVLTGASRLCRGPCHLRGGPYNRMRSNNGYRLYPIHLNTNERQKATIPEYQTKRSTFWQGVFLILVASFISIVAWIWAYRLLAHSDEHSQYFVAGHVMAGLACICSSLIALVATIARQIRNTYSRLEKKAMAPFCHPDGIYQSDMGPLRIRR